MPRNESTSYIFANCKGERAHTISQIQRIPNVENATPVTGRFDLVIRLNTNEPRKVSDWLNTVATLLVNTVRTNVTSDERRETSSPVRRSVKKRKLN